MSDLESEWWKKIPVPTLCEWWILQMILGNDSFLSIYKLTKYAETLEGCEESRTRYKIEILLRSWQEFGLIRVVNLYNKKGAAKNILITEKGKEFARRVRYWYEGYVT